METIRRVLLLFCLIPFFAGCSSTKEQRNAFFANLSPEPVSCEFWKNYVGKYQGSMHSTARAFGSTGTTVSEIHFDLGGTPDEPLIYLELDSACTSAWTMSGTYLEKYTNIPERTYGVHGRLTAYSHGPNQLQINLEPDLTSPNRGGALILTFHDKGMVSLESIGHFERRGSGSLDRVRAFNLFKR